MENTIFIEIHGIANSGKSFLLKHIKELLRKEGITVLHNPELCMDPSFISEEQFDDFYAGKSVIEKAVLAKKTIVISEHYIMKKDVPRYSKLLKFIFKNKS